MTSPQPLAGRTALVTGGSGNIGSAITVALASAGADVAISYRHGADRARAVAERVTALGRRAEIFQADLESADSGVRLVDGARERLGHLDVFVSNAGFGEPVDWTELSEDSWNRGMAVNVGVPFAMIQRAVPAMIERSWGRVLLISSVAALNGGSFGAHYAASKAALHGLTHHLAPRVAPHGVTVNTLAPAIIGEDSVAPLGEEGARRIIDRIPVGRVGTLGEAAEMALAMVTNGYLTNKIVTLDGGLLAR